MTLLQVSDAASHRRDQIANLAEVLRGSPAKQKVFAAVYWGKKQGKTVRQIADSTGYKTKRVTELAKPLARQSLFLQKRERIDGERQTVYTKIDFVATTTRVAYLSLQETGRSLRRITQRRIPGLKLALGVLASVFR